MIRQLPPAILLLAGALVAPGCGQTASVQATTAGDQQVAAQVGDQTITLEEVDKKALMAPASQFSGALLHALYDARRQAIDQLVADTLMEKEAKARGITTAELFEDEVNKKAAPVQESEVEAWYAQNAARVRGGPIDQVRRPVRDLLERDRRQAAFDTFLAALKSKTPVRVVLEPPRQDVRVADNDPALGPADARIQIVEFSDFQ